MFRLAVMLTALAITSALASCGGGEAPASAPTAAASQPATMQPTPTRALAATSAAASGVATAVPVTPTPSVQASTRTTGQVDGIRFAVSQGSKATFTVREQLVRVTLPIDAVLATEALTGDVFLDGKASAVTVNLHSLTSNEANRDRYVRTQMFPQSRTATFNIAGFTTLPAGFTEGEEVKAQVNGVLNIQGVQAPMTFDVEARDDGGVIYVVARSSFTWEDIGMSAPRAQVVVSVEDTVKVEVLLALRAASS